jgi:multiple sugar transport system permease protein
MSQTTQSLHRPLLRWRTGKLRKSLNGEALLALLFILPSLLGFLIFYAIPTFKGILLSFTNADLLTEPQFVGLKNYRTMIDDKLFWNAMKVTLIYVLVNIPVQTVMALGLAALMDRCMKSVVGRSVLLLPALMSYVVVALMWSWLLSPGLGIVNQMLATLGFETQAFLAKPELVMPSIAGIYTWRNVGQTALLLFAGLQSIPANIYEAARIDGASERRMFFSITLPLLRPVLAFVLVTTLIGSFQVYDIVAVTTKGGPINASRVIQYYIVEKAIGQLKMGYASAMAVALFSILILVTMIQLKYFRANTSDLS